MLTGRMIYSDILNVGFKDITMKLVDIKIGEPDELDSEDFLQGILTEGLRRPAITTKPT